MPPSASIATTACEVRRSAGIGATPRLPEGEMANGRSAAVGLRAYANAVVRDNLHRRAGRRRRVPQQRHRQRRDQALENEVGGAAHPRVFAVENGQQADFVADSSVIVRDAEGLAPCGPPQRTFLAGQAATGVLRSRGRCPGVADQNAFGACGAVLMAASARQYRRRQPCLWAGVVDLVTRDCDCALHLRWSIELTLPLSNCIGIEGNRRCCFLTPSS